MWEFTGIIKDLTIDFRTGSAVLSLKINERQQLTECFDELNLMDKLAIRIDRYRKKRSLDANAYFWVLADRLSAKTGVPKEEVYRNAIRDIGENSETVCIKEEAADKFRKGWSRHGLGWVTEEFPSKLPGCVNVVLYYGSSTYDTAQMSRLIDNIVQDCKAVGVETATPEEINVMLKRWEDYEKHHTK